jgi:hypothetical protein
MSNPLSDDEEMLVSGYVLGDLTAEETELLEQKIAANPDLLKEIHAVQASFGLLPQGLPSVEPPPSLREAILTAPELQQHFQPKRSIGLLLKLALGLLALAASALAIDNWQLRQQLQVAQTNRVDRVAALLQQPNSRLIALTSKNSKAAGTLLFQRGRWQEAIISLGNLPPLPPDRIYRMWLSLENGETLYCGAFNTDVDGSVFIRLTPPKTPPRGVKAKRLFVTIDAVQSPLTPAGEQVMEGAI